MKKLIACLALLYYSVLAISQDTTGTTGRRTEAPVRLQSVSNSQSQVITPIVGGYIWNQRTLIYPCDEDGNPDPARTPQLTLVNQRFSVIRDLDDFVIINIDAYPPNSPDLKKAYNTGPFYVQTTMLKVCAVKNLRIRGSFAFGIINFPFKYRIQKRNNDFSGSFNFGAALGINLGHYSWNKWNFTLLTSYSISNVNLDSISVSKNADKLTKTNNYTAFSLAAGFLITYEKVQAGLFLGTDILSRINEATFNWKYQGKPWISVGFGYSIFAGSKTVEGEGGN